MNSKVPTVYRPDIDGLRAIAVMGVVLYHAGATFIPGGFVGVDIFFVISGFLITSILLRQMDAGTLSIKSFYERRIRRIMPALFVMMGAVLAFGFLRMFPWEMKELATSAKYAICSVSNIFFNRATGGYFDNAAENMPLLHTWSLGVEEQFYVFFPLLMMAAMRLKCGRRKLFVLLMSVGVASLVLSVWAVHRGKSQTAFYWIHFRAWELMVGALLAFLLPWLAKNPLAPRRAHWLANGAGCLGLGMIAFAMAVYGRRTLFPGESALLPCLGAALIIAAGQLGSHWVGRLLALRPMVAIGLISYSVYLWHWPMLVFQRQLALTDAVGTWGFSPLWVGLASLPMGYLSWRLVEQPFRGERFKGWRLFTGWAVLSIAFGAFALAAERTQGFEGRMPEQVRHLLAFKKSRNPIQDEAFQKKLPISKALVYGDESHPPTVALWGDSHAHAIAYEMGVVAKSHHTSFRFYGWTGNPPMVGVYKNFKETSRQEHDYNASVMRQLEEDQSIKEVVLVARWSLILRGFTDAYGPAESLNGFSAMYGSPPLMADAQGNQLGIREAELAYANGIRDMIARLRAAGKTVFLIYPIPEVGYNVPDTLAREAMHGRDPAHFQVLDKKIFWERQSFVLSLFDSLPDGSDLVRLKPHKLLTENGHIRLIQDGKVLYFDDNHLSLEGAHLLRPLFEKIFSK